MAKRERLLYCALGMVLGLAIAGVAGRQPAARAADPAPAGAADKPTQPQQQVLVDEKEMRLSYANAYRVHTAEQEAVIDFGFNMPNPNPQPGQEQQTLLKVSDRMVLSYVTTKRLSLSLAALVKRYEERFGEIPVGATKGR